MRISSLFFAGLVVFGSAAIASACAASGVGDDESDSGASGDDGGQGTDGSPVGSDGGVSDGAPGDGSGGDGGCFLQAGAKCEVFPNCGCSGTTCDFPTDGGAEVFCEPDAGVTSSAGSCVTSEDCIGGETCLFSKCRTYCGTLGAICPDPKLSACRAHGAVPGDYVCGIRCDLTSPTSCNPAPGGCVVLAAGATASTTECEPVGVLAVGATCVTTNDCAPSLVCINNGGVLTCQQRCTPTGVKGSCATGTCTAEAPPLTIEGVDYGYCQ